MFLLKKNSITTVSWKFCRVFTKQLFSRSFCFVILKFRWELFLFMHSSGGEGVILGETGQWFFHHYWANPEIRWITSWYFEPVRSSFMEKNWFSQRSDWGMQSYLHFSCSCLTLIGKFSQQILWQLWLREFLQFAGAYLARPC